MLTAVLLGFTMSAGTAPAETLEQRLERMENEIRDLRSELRRRDAADAKKAGKPAAARAKAPAAEPHVVAEKPAPAAPPTVVADADVSPKTKDPRALDAIMDRVQLGGYGSVRFEGSSLEDQKATFTFRRFVLTTDANIAPRFRAYMELEFERFRELELEKSTHRNAEGGIETEQEIEGSSDSEISMEQAWMQFDLNDWLHMRAGNVLVPLGRFNINHDDNRWDLPRRSLVVRGTPVLPADAAWSELGAGVLGDMPVGEQSHFSYQAYVVNGLSLDTNFEQILSTRRGDTTLNAIEAEVTPAAGTFGSDVKDAKAVTGRMALSPLIGHEVGLSGYYGQYTPDFLGKEDLWSTSVDGRTGWGPFELEGEYVYTRFEGVKNVAKRFAREALNHESESEAGDVETEVEFELANLARAKQGYWLEGRYRFWPILLNDTFLGRGFDNPQLVAVLRGEQVWLDGLVQEVDFAGGQLTNFEDDHRYVARFTAGLAYRPVPSVAFQLAYEYTMTDSGQSLSGVTNFLPAQEDEDHAHTVLVGAVFGF
jgi:hypothetical protein